MPEFPTQTMLLPKWKCRFRFVLVFMNSVVVVAFGVILVIYFTAYPHGIHQWQRAKEGIKDFFRSGSGRCEPITLEMCRSPPISYNATVFPNLLGHSSRSAVASAVLPFENLLSSRCSPLLPFFLCSILAPKCGKEGEPIPPCRELCEEVFFRCEFFFAVFQMAWHNDLPCNQFPAASRDTNCMGSTIQNDQANYPECEDGFQCDENRCLPSKWRCDGYEDCKDRSDEKNCISCSVNEFYCGRQKCIPLTKVCDGSLDCFHGQDETNCVRLVEPQGKKGLHRLELYVGSQRKWIPACGDNWNVQYDSTAACQKLGYREAKETRLQAVTPFVNTHSFPAQRLFARAIRKPCNTSALCSVEVFIKCRQLECGWKQESSLRRHRRIVGGIESFPGSWPWLAGLLGGPAKVFFCAGVLISDQWILTASHCIGNQTDTKGWSVILGSIRRNSFSEEQTQWKVKRIIPHTVFTRDYDHDIALLQLSDPVSPTTRVRPVCLPQEGVSVSDETVCTVIGWGKLEHGMDVDYQLGVHEVQVPILPSSTCRKWLNGQGINIVVTDNMICAGYAEGKKDSCQGDSGGPLLCQDSRGRWMVTGIVSWGIKCALPQLPGVYTNVSRYRNWINRHMRSEIHDKETEEEVMIKRTGFKHQPTRKRLL